MTENRKMRVFAWFALFPWPNEKEGLAPRRTIKRH